MNHYETVLILTPVLTDAQSNTIIEKYVNLLQDQKAEIIHKERWGLKKLAYSIQNKSTGYYYLIEFSAPPTAISVLETEFRRDESIMRYITVAQDRYAQKYAERRRKGEFKKEKDKKNNHTKTTV